MLKSILGLLLVLANATAYAHVPDGDHGIAAQFFHQLYSTHHLPLTLLLLAGVLVAAGIYRANKSSRR